MVFETKSKILNENAIVFSNSGFIAKKLTYQQVQTISSLINQFLSDKLPERQVCVGLHMTHNIYIPSLVIR